MQLMKALTNAITRQFSDNEPGVTMAVLFGLDISHHQDKSLDLARARQDGCEFVLLKAGEGSGYVDPDFGSNLAEARAAGMLVGAYWYIRSNASAAAHVDLITRTVPSIMPIIPDVEANSGGVALVRDIINRLRAKGYTVPLLYLPRWYWQQIGSPSLVGLPPLWSSRYPDNVVGLLPSEWAQVPASYWSGYGGLSVAVLQFTSSAKIAGYAPLDANAFQGSRTALAALFGQHDTPPAPTPTTPQPEEEPMLAKASPDGVAYVPTYGHTGLYIQSGYGHNVSVKELTFIGPTPQAPEGGNYTGQQQKGWTFHADRPGPVGVPPGTVAVTILYSAEADFVAWCA